MLLFVLLTATMVVASAPKPTVRALSTQRQLEIDEVISFAKGKGAVISEAFRVVQIQGKGEAVVASRAVKKGEQVLFAPPTVTISPRWASNRWPDWHQLKMPPHVLVALALAVEKFHAAPDTLWNRLLQRDVQQFGPYMRVLSDSCYCGYSFTVDEMAWLAKVGTGNALSFSDLSKDYHHYLVATGFTSVTPVTLEQFQWASCTAITRSWLGHNMIPAGDFFNHDDNANVGMNRIARSMEEKIKAENDAKRGMLHLEHGVVFEAFGDIAAGEEMTINYGHRTNLEFLINYGFVYHDNKHDNMHLPLPRPRENAAVEKLLLTKVALSKTLNRDHILMTWKGFDSSAVCALRLLVEEKVDSYFYTRIHG
jgi:hypothetical protein